MASAGSLADSSLCDLNPCATVDVRISHAVPEDRRSVWLWGKHVLHKYYRTSVLTSNDATARFAGYPAACGITIAAKFK